LRPQDGLSWLLVSVKYVFDWVLLHCLSAIPQAFNTNIPLYFVAKMVDYRRYRKRSLIVLRLRLEIEGFDVRKLRLSSSLHLHHLYSGNNRDKRSKFTCPAVPYPPLKVGNTPPLIR